MNISVKCIWCWLVWLQVKQNIIIDSFSEAPAPPAPTTTMDTLKAQANFAQHDKLSPVTYDHDKLSPVKYELAKLASAVNCELCGAKEASEDELR